MSPTIPHYLLFSESRMRTRPDARQAESEGAGRWRIVLEAVDGSSQFEASDEETGSAERLELLAVVRGLEALPQPSRVTLLTPSRYVNRGLRFGLAEWRENGWQWERFGEMSTVSNADLWQRLDRALRIHQVHCRSWRFDQAHGTPAASRSAGRQRDTGAAARTAADRSGSRSALHRLRQWWPKSWQTASLRAS